MVYNVLLPKDLALEEGKGITIANREAAVILYPGEGSFRDGQVKDNAIRYSNVFPGIDYQYTVLGNSVKEDIILLERGEKNSFTYHIDPCGLSGEIRNNALYLYEPGADPESEAAFVLEAPEMTDSAGEVSFGVAMTMEEREGLFSVTVTADKSWLEDAKRVYPVRIAKKLSAGVHAGGVNKIQSLFRGHVPRKSTLRAELGPDSLLKKDASHLF